jgi:hypothetical protein
MDDYLPINGHAQMYWTKSILYGRTGVDATVDIDAVLV